MLRRSWIASPLLALGLAAAASTPALAGITVEIRPPAPKVEVAPSPRSGYVWQEGYWDWNGSDYVWREGTWVAERPGYRWVSHRWVERDGSKWYAEPGRWERVDGPDSPPPPPPPPR